MTDLTRLRFNRGVIKSKVTRLKTFVDDLDLDKLDINVISQLKRKLAKLEPVLDEFERTQCEVEFAAGAEEPEERVSFENSYYELISQIEAVINEFTSSNASVDQSVRNLSDNNMQSQQVRLPIINLPNFNGKYEQWLEFRDSFTSLIHNNESISAIQKFYYLRSCLQGEAAQVIHSMETTVDNYPIAWQLIQERYENKRLVVHNYVRAMFNAPSIKRETRFNLRNLYDTFTKSLRALKSLGQPTDTWDTLIVHLITSKFDEVTNKEWESWALEGELPAMSDINNFLKKRCEILEKLETRTDTGKAYVRGNKSNSNAYVNTNISCFYCGKAHTMYKCEVFLKLPVKTKIQEVKRLKLCNNCFKPSHNTFDCTASNCRKCGKRHNSLLHIGNDTSAVASGDSVAETAQGVTDTSQVNVGPKCEQNTAVVGYSGDNIPSSQILLSTVQILIEDHDGNMHKCRALLDSGSQSNFITSKMCKRLGLNTAKIRFTISGVGAAAANIKEETSLKISSINNSYNKTISALVLEKITNNLPTVSFVSTLNIPKNVKLADPSFSQSTSIDVLLGSNVFWETMCAGQIRLEPELLVLHKTLFGWVVTGELKHNSVQLNNNVSCLSVNLSNEKLEKQLTKFWQLEEVNSEPILSEEDNFCESHFLENTRRAENGQFIVTVPLKSNASELGDSRQFALNRFLAMEKRLTKNNKLRDEYVTFMREYETLSHMRPITEASDEDETSYYLPHHAVIREQSKTTKIRVVFDASMKTDSGVSLNEIQYSGPTIQSDLISILLRFRMYEFVMTADISKMYRQVLLNPDQGRLHRIFWRPDPNSELKCYELKTVTYGTASAPFLAIRCLHQLAEEHKSIYPRACEVIKTDFYVDDLLTGSNSQDELVKLQNEITTILKAGGFELRKWLCNKSELIDNFQINQELAVNIISLGENQHNKVLGIRWNANSDNIQFSMNQCIQNNISKRHILSIVSQVFDPLGLLGPIIIIAKILIQKLWLLKISWDETVPENLHEQWRQFLNNLNRLNGIDVPRYIFMSDYQVVELHSFCDASERAFGACVYVRCKNKLGQYSVHLLCAKSRVAPVKQVSLPRLELCGALLLSRLVDKVKDALNIQFNNVFYYCDSTITLSWIRGPPTRWKTFVANRTSEIQRLTRIEEWRHVKSIENPADLISRGTDAETLQNSKLWWYGPSFLLDDNRLISEEELSLEHIPEQRTTDTVVAAVINKTFELFNKYSSLHKLQRITAYCYRFINNCRQPIEKRNLNHLTVQELQNAMNSLIISCQQQAFPDEYNSLSKNKCINKSSKLISLNPFMHENIIRVGGRIRHSNFDYDKKFPIILPAKHNLTTLIIVNEHIRLMHSGPSMLLASVRERYWPIAGRSETRKIVRNCVICFKNKPVGVQYKMGDLPAFRVNPSTPFQKTGIDYAGPFFIKDRKTRGAKVTKAYVCLFICLAIKAVHLELVSDLTTDGFLATLKRFIARRGKPMLLLSDNASNFVGANAKLQEVQSFFCKNLNAIVTQLSADNITWEFIPPRAPNFGGIYEAGIKSTKHHLRRIIGNAALTFEEFATILSQVEAILNSRPLFPLSSDPSDPNPLTPAHFLVGKPLTAIPEHDVKEIPENRLTKYERLQNLVQHFWSRWKKEYIAELQMRVKWKHNCQNLLQVGTIVLVKQENTPPCKWPLGRVIKLYPGSDGTIRVVSVRLGNCIVKRSVTKLCVLPTSDSDQISN